MPSTKKNTPFTWEGIYKQYKDVAIKISTEVNGLNSGLWTDLSIDYTKSVIERSKQNKMIPVNVTGEHILLPLLASIICSPGKQLKILDFGGGLGSEYIYLKNSLIKNKMIDYRVIELENMSKAGLHLLDKDDNIKFTSTIPKNLSEIDIIYIKSALQYVDNYRILLKNLCAISPRYFFFVKLSAGDIPTYATLQKNMPDIKMAYWFINVKEIIDIMSENNFSLIYKSALDEEYNQDNFPETHRMGRACNLLFERR